MVIVCGANMGDIFRRNALNLGLHVIQSPEAVADAQDGDEFAFDPATRRLENVTQGKNVRAAAADAARRKKSAAAAASSPSDGANSATSVERARSSTCRTRRCARPMTATEQIVWAHRVDKDAASLVPAPRCACTPICCPPPTARRRSPSTPSTRSPAATDLSTAGGDRQRSLRLHRACGRRRQQTSIGRAFAQRHGIEQAVLRDAGRRHLSFLFSGAGAGPARAVHRRRRFAQPRLWRLRRGRHRRGIDDARVRLGDGLRVLHRAEAATRGLSRKLQPWVSGKDIVLELLRRWGRTAGPGDVGRIRRRRSPAADRLPQHDREHDGGGGGA